MPIHLLRPWWLLAYIPWLFLLWLYLRSHVKSSAWHKICDDHLLPYLTKTFGVKKSNWPFFSVFFSAWFMILSLTGISWSHVTVPTYQRLQPRVILLDLSEEMLQTDL